MKIMVYTFVKNYFIKLNISKNLIQMFMFYESYFKLILETLVKESMLYLIKKV